VNCLISVESNVQVLYDMEAEIHCPLIGHHFDFCFWDISRPWVELATPYWCLVENWAPKFSKLSKSTSDWI